MRVVSLVPSVTETLSTWGVPPIACTRFCERPDIVEVGGTKNPNIDAIVSLQPDVVVLDAQENRREDAVALQRAGIRLVTIDVISITTMIDGLTELADALDIAVTLELPRLEPMRHIRAFIPIWRRPWMSFNEHTFASDLLSIIGVGNVCSQEGETYPEVTLDDIASRQVDVVLVPSEPYEFSDDHLAELRTIAPTLRVDGRDLFWWGARTVEASHRLRDVIATAMLRD